MTGSLAPPLPLKKSGISGATGSLDGVSHAVQRGAVASPRPPSDSCSRSLGIQGAPLPCAPPPPRAELSVPLLQTTRAHCLQPLLISFSLHLLIIFLAFLQTLSCLSCTEHPWLAARGRGRN